MEAALMPLPTPETTPPETIINLLDILAPLVVSHLLAYFYKPFLIVVVLHYVYVLVNPLYVVRDIASGAVHSVQRGSPVTAKLQLDADKAQRLS
jgi:hypothetical protein